MSDIELDPSLKKKQNEWVNLLYAEELSCRQPPVCMLTSVHDRAIIASRLYEDAVAGRKVDFPQTKLQIFCYTLTRSKRFLMLFSLVCFTQAILPFFAEPFCPWKEVSDGLSFAEYYASGPYLSKGAMNILDMICVIVYCVEVFARLSVNFHLNDIRSRLQYDYWATVRGLCVLLLLIDVIVGFATYSSFLFSRCLLPVIYISRRKSLRQMIHGLIISTRKCLEVFNLVVFLLLLFSVSGFVLFRNLEVDGRNHFSDLGTSLLTCLHVYESRSFNIFLSNVYYPNGELTLLFFVFLLVLMDLLSTSFIIAIGSREYKSFANVTYVSELRRRRKALQALFNALAIGDEQQQQQQPHEEGCESLSISGRRIPHSMWILFCAQLRGPYKISSDIATAVFRMECSRTGRDSIDIIGLARLCAILDAKIDASNLSDAELKRQAHSSMKSVLRLKLTLRPNSKQIGRSKLTPSLDEIRNSLCDESEALETMNLSEAIAFMLIKMRILSIKFLRIKLSLRFRQVIQEVELFSCLASLFRILSVIQLCCVTRSQLRQSDAEGLLAFGILLEICFWLEMCVLMSAWGAMMFLRRSYHGLSAGVNVLVALLMMAHGNSIWYNNDDGLSLAVISFQCLRFLRIFRYVKGRDKLQSLIPLVMRVLFIIFAIIYFFAIFAYNRFCSSLKVEMARDVDDIASSWVDYANVLNFDTLLNSIFTLFQLSVLGSWSMVMQAAALMYPASSLIFFYVFRLIMTIILYPLLFSFIIQIYTARSQTPELTKKQQQQQQQQPSEDAVFNDIMRNNSGDVSLADWPRHCSDDIEGRRSAGDAGLSVSSRSSSLTSTAAVLKKRITIGPSDDTNRMMSYWSSDTTALKSKLGGEHSRDFAASSEEKLAIVLELKSELEKEIVKLKNAMRELQTEKNDILASAQLLEEKPIATISECDEDEEKVEDKQISNIE